ncbi:MAG: AAA family ATPase [Novosphingobium sp.]|jgi:pilus assembly protein CpaE|nr:AAA family ATPase [Novosphingobium sp.]
MNLFSSPLSTGPDGGRTRRSTRILVIAEARYGEVLMPAMAAAALPGLWFESLDSNETVPDAMLRDAAVLVLEVHPESPASMRRLGDVRARRPDLPVIAAIEGASPALVRALVREGISDVVFLPFDIQELSQAALDAAARVKERAAADQGLAPLVSVVRSVGGCGATTIAVQLAADLAAHHPGDNGVVIADLDLQYGSVHDFMGTSTARGTVMELLAAGDRLDGELIQSMVARADCGVSIVCAPDEITPLESVDAAQLLRLVELLRQQFGHVVLDFPHDWTNWALSAALASDMIVLVVDLSVIGLGQARRRLELFRSIGIDSSAIEIVVNRAEKRLFGSINPKDVADALGCSILGSVALEAPLVSTAQNQGRLVGEVREKSRFCKDIAQLGSLVRERLRARCG